ncbi:hypothetical protein Tco_0259598 [Tanacetum coccineum]
MLLAKKDEATIILTNEQNDFLLVDASEIEDLEDLSANICMMARIQQPDSDSKNGPIYDSAFNSELNKELEKYKVKVQDFKNKNENKTNFHNEYIEADKQAKKLEIQFQTQFIQDRGKIMALEKEKEELQMNVSIELKQSLQLKNECTALKHKFNKQEDRYLDDILNLEKKVKQNENVVVKMSNSVQAMFMLGPKPTIFNDSQMKHSLGYENSYTLKKSICVNPKLFDASYIHSSNVHAHVCDAEEILEDATRGQLKMKGKLEDLIAIEKKVTFLSVNYGKMNDLYETFVPQVELSLEQKYFSKAYTSNETTVNTNWTTLTRDCNKFVRVVDEHARLSGGNDSACLVRCYKTFNETWVLEIRKYRSLPLISLDSLYSNIWKLDRLVKEKPMESPWTRPYPTGHTRRIRNFFEGELVIFLEGELAFFFEGELVVFFEGELAIFLEGELVTFLEGELALFFEGELVIFLEGELAIFLKGELVTFLEGELAIFLEEELAMILSGADNRPPMLDKDLYDSWKSRMELYMQNREHRRMILESVEHGPLIWPTIEENRVTRTKKYVELSPTERIQADCDMEATNIILQGLPTDIYSLVNHHKVAKDL